MRVLKFTTMAICLVCVGLFVAHEKEAVGRMEIAPRLSQCQSSFKSYGFSIIEPPQLSSYLVAQVNIEDDHYPSKIRTKSAFLFGKVPGYGGFARPVEGLIFEQTGKKNIYQAKIDLAQFVTKTNLWPAIAKAQKDYGLDSVESTLSTRLLDDQGCQTDKLTAKTSIDIKGYTRNNAISGSAPILMSVRSPKTIEIGKEFQIVGRVYDMDGDLQDVIPILGSMSVSQLPFKLRLPPTVHAVRVEDSLYRVTISTAEFGFYRHLINILPLDEIKIDITIMIEDQAGHQSNPYTFPLVAVLQK